MANQFCKLVEDKPEYADLFFETKSRIIEPYSISNYYYMTNNGFPANPKLVEAILSLSRAFDREYYRNHHLEILEKQILALRAIDLHGLSMIETNTSPWVWGVNPLPSMAETYTSPWGVKPQPIFVKKYSFDFDIATIPDIQKALDAIRNIKEEEIYVNDRESFQEEESDENYSYEDEEDDDDDAIDLVDPATED